MAILLKFNLIVMNFFIGFRELFYEIWLLLFFCLIGCQQAKVSSNIVSEEDLKQLPKIDVHAHYKYPRSYLPNFFERWNMKAMLVDVAIEQGDSIVKNFDNYLTHYELLPELFYLCTTFIADGIESPDYIDKTIAKLKSDIAQGARMVKVWKNFGMVTKDSKGNYIQIDDQRLNPIWDFLIEN
jgi:hypothetical protein